MRRPSSVTTSLRQLLYERLCGQAAALAVLSIAIASCGWSIVMAGLQLREELVAMIGGVGLTAPLACAWILRDPDAARRTPQTAGPSAAAPARSQPSEIDRMSDAEFELLLDEVERQRRMPFPPPCPVAAGVSSNDDAFAHLVRDALDALPQFVQHELGRGNLAVMISDYGCEWHAYGLYCGGTAADDDYHHHITIFRDTLTARYGDDPDELRRQVNITVRHEVAHHFGADERRVRELAL